MRYKMKNYNSLILRSKGIEAVITSDNAKKRVLIEICRGPTFNLTEETTFTPSLVFCLSETLLLWGAELLHGFYHLSRNPSN